MTTTTLTDRYVDAILRRVPARQRPDIDKELRASIADAVDDRLEAGGDRADSEVAVLTALGDPARLAAGYADRPLHLIGPALYLDYTRVLTALLATVVPIVVAVIGVIQTMDGAAVLTIIGESLGAGVTTAVHIAVWTTLFFALLERAHVQRWAPLQPWTPAALPEPPSRRARYGELIAETVALVLFTAFILLSPVVSSETDTTGDPIGFLSPWLWETGVVYVFIALVIGSLAVSFAKYYARWGLPLALGAALVELASPILLIWLAVNDRVLNPAFVEAVGWSSNAVEWANRGLVIAAVLTIVHTVVEAAKRIRNQWPA